MNNMKTGLKRALTNKKYSYYTWCYTSGYSFICRL